MSANNKLEQSVAGALLESACRLFERIAIFMLLLTTFLIVLQIIARNFFEIGLPWADELARYGGLGIVFLAVPLLLLYNGHIAVDIISSRLKGTASKILSIINEAIILVFCALFLIGSYQFLQSAGRFVTPALRWPNVLFYLPAMLGIILFSLVAIRRFWCVLKYGDPRATLDESGAQP